MDINHIKTLDQDARLAQSAQRYDDAKALYREALTLAMDRNQPTLLAVLLNRVGRVQEVAGDIQEAVISYETGLRYLARDDSSSPDATLDRILRTLQGMSKGYSNSPSLADPLELYPQILSADLEAAMADPHLGVKLLINIGNAYLRQPQDNAAREAYEQALQHPATDHAPDLKAYLLTHLGIIARRAEDLSGAETYLIQAQGLFATLADPLRQRRALVALAGLYDHRGETDRALETYQQALPLYHQASDPHGEVRTRTRLGRLLLAQQQLPEAEAQYQAALPLAERLADEESLWHIHWGVGCCQAAREDWDDAIQSFNQSLRLIEQRQDNLATDQGKVTFVDSVSEIYDALVTIHLQRHDFGQALTVAERARGQALIDLMGVRHRQSSVRPTDTRRASRTNRQRDIEGHSGRHNALRLIL